MAARPRFPHVDRLRAEAALLDAQLAELDSRLAEVDARRAAIGARLGGPSWKWLRDLLGAGAGIVLAPPTNGFSLILTFWVSCGLLVDGLDLAPLLRELLELRTAVRAIDLQRGEVLARLEELEAELLRSG